MNFFLFVLKLFPHLVLQLGRTLRHVLYFVETIFINILQVCILITDYFPHGSIFTSKATQLAFIIAT